MNEEQKINNPVQVKNKIEFSWSIPWTCGWLFTIGIGAFQQYGQAFSAKAPNVLEAFLYLIVTYLIWPFALGMHFAK